MTLTFGPLFRSLKLKQILHINVVFKRDVSDNKWKILFFGSDNFSLSSLKALHGEHVKGNINHLEVVSNKIDRTNVVLKFANEKNLTVHGWPLSFNPEGLFHLGIVVSFGHLIPGTIINAFPMGILNVHGSLLPRWRGASPIVYSLLNGDKRTGVSIMKIHPKRFDVGDIVAQKEFEINDDIFQPELYKSLADIGANTLVECLHNLPNCLNKAIPQSNINATYAPKVTKSISYINWKENSATQIYNLSRALYGIFPLLTQFKSYQLKLVKLFLWSKFSDEEKNVKPPGYFAYVKERDVIRVWCNDGQSIYFDTVGISTKKNMSAVDFKNGFMKHLSDKELCFSSAD